MAAYPGAIANLSNPLGTNSMADPSILHSAQHTNANDEIEAIETELGTNPSGTYNTVTERFAGVESGLGAAVPPGVIFEWAGATAPTGFFLCYGQVVSRTTYAALFANIGTLHNTGGEAGTDFRLPDRRGRFGLGLDNMGGTDAGRVASANAVGTTGGLETTTLIEANLPGHLHNMNHGHASTFAVTSMTGNSGDDSPDHAHTLPDHAHGAYTFGGNGAHAHNMGLGDSSTIAAGTSTRTHLGSKTTDSQGGHEHNVGVNGSGALGVTGASVRHQHSISHGHAMTGSVTNFTGATDAGTGTATPFGNMPPFVTMNYIIKY